MHRDPFCEKIVRSIIGLARDLEIECLAEGIETNDQCAALRAMGCHSGQGFLFGSAMPPSQVPRYLMRSYQGYRRQRRARG
jgi:EAL domain-containing protein (putative c-di-GMP-specific phosphodiesterase class I)